MVLSFLLLFGFSDIKPAFPDFFFFFFGGGGHCLAYFTSGDILWQRKEIIPFSPSIFDSSG